MQIAKWIFLRVWLVTALWLGLIEGLPGAMNVAQFMVWFGFLFYMLSTTEAVLETLAKSGRSVPIWVSVSFDVVILLALLWFGYLVTAVVFALGGLIREGILIKVEEERARA